MSDGYGKKEYWEERYRAGGATEEWLQSWAGLRPVVAPHLPSGAPLVVLGCGTSTLGEELWDEGWRDLLAVDYSAAAVAAMRARAGERPGLRYLEADVRALPLAEGACGAAIDKGTLDCLACGEAPEETIAAMAAEIRRVLAPGGVWICVSMRPPRARLGFFDGWQVKVERVDKLPIVSSNQRAAALRARALAEASEEERLEMTSNWVYFLGR